MMVDKKDYGYAEMVWNRVESCFSSKRRIAFIATTLLFVPIPFASAAYLLFVGFYNRKLILGQYQNRGTSNRREAKEGDLAKRL